MFSKATKFWILAVGQVHGLSTLQSQSLSLLSLLSPGGLSAFVEACSSGRLVQRDEFLDFHLVLLHGLTNRLTCGL